MTTAPKRLRAATSTSPNIASGKVEGSGISAASKLAPTTGVKLKRLKL